MNYKVPGLASILMIGVALGIADYRLFLVSPWLGSLYLLCLPLALASTLYYYCRQCPHAAERTCPHVVVGWVVAKLFKLKSPAPYTARQLALALLPPAALFVFPQPWLWQDRVLFLAFWVSAILGGTVIVLGVCPSCKNVHCPGCPKRSK